MRGAGGVLKVGPGFFEFCVWGFFRVFEGFFGLRGSGGSVLGVRLGGLAGSMQGQS